MRLCEQKNNNNSKKQNIYSLDLYTIESICLLFSKSSFFLLKSSCPFVLNGNHFIFDWKLLMNKDTINMIKYDKLIWSTEKQSGINTFQFKL